MSEALANPAAPAAANQVNQPQNGIMGLAAKAGIAIALLAPSVAQAINPNEASANENSSDPMAQTASSGLNGFGPKYSHSLSEANRQLDQRLEIEGADGCTARAVAELAGIHTHAGRAKYITAENVDFRRKKTATSKNYPINTGTHACKDVVKIVNNHKKSKSYTIEMDEVPSKTKHIAREVEGKGDKDVNYELTRGVLRADCGGNALEHKGRRRRGKAHENTFEIDVTVGVLAAAQSVATSESSSSSSVAVTCPDGTKVNSQSAAHAESAALAQAIAAAKASGVEFVISGRNMSYRKFVARVLAKANAFVLAATSATSSSSSSIAVECGTGPTPPVTPPKDSTEGPGAGTPGNTDTGGTVGGPGAGGQPGNNPEAVPCYDPANGTAGDSNVSTTGDIMYVGSTNNVDQFGYCTVPAAPSANG